MVPIPNLWPSTANQRVFDWDQLLPFPMFTNYTSVHETTNFKSYELVFGQKSRTPSFFPQGVELKIYDSHLRNLIVRLSEIQKIAARNLVRAKKRSNAFYVQKSLPLKAKIGDQIYAIKEVREGKFDSRREEPFTVVGFTENNVTYGW